MCSLTNECYISIHYSIDIHINMPVLFALPWRTIAAFLSVTDHLHVYVSISSYLKLVSCGNYKSREFLSFVRSIDCASRGEFQHKKYDDFVIVIIVICVNLITENLRDIRIHEIR